LFFPRIVNVSNKAQKIKNFCNCLGISRNAWDFCKCLGNSGNSSIA
jgi:hypothetical protein